MPAQPLKSGSDRLLAAEREAAEVLPAPAGNPRFPLMDSLRAIAAISILIVHVGIFSGGFEPWYKNLLAHTDIGVPFFFLLSGFLLYRPMLASRVLDMPKQRLRDYGRNRFFRIFPAYWLVLTLTAIVPGMYGAFTGNWWVYYGLLNHFPVYTPEGECATIAIRCGVPPTWSLAVEVGFYLVLPLFALGMSGLMKLVGRRHWFATELSILGLISVISFFIQRSVPTGDLHAWLFFSPLGRGWWFALGMGLAALSVLVSARPARPRPIEWISAHPAVAWAAAIVIYVAMTFALLEPKASLAAPVEHPDQYLIQYFLVGIISALVILPAIFPGEGEGIPRRILRHPVLVWLGLISYGIFLWHYPVMIWLIDLGVLDVWPANQFLVLAASTFSVTVVLSAISFRLVERPLMRWSRRKGAGSAAKGGLTR